MNVGWLMDRVDDPGGAELTQREFRDAAPDDITIVDCPPGGVVEGLDVYVGHNLVQYRAGDLQWVGDRTVVKYHHDVGPHVAPDVTAWLREHAVNVCCSPIQAERMGLPDAHLVPPAVDLQAFRDAAGASNGARSGTVSVAAWGNPGKAPHLVSEWAHANGEHVDFYGGGVCAPEGSAPVPYGDLPGLLTRYRRFVFLPAALEPFGRTVAEAWAAGLEVITNRLVGARWWIEQRPWALDSAADDFWELVTVAAR